MLIHKQVLILIEVQNFVNLLAKERKGEGDNTSYACEVEKADW